MSNIVGQLQNETSALLRQYLRTDESQRTVIAQQIAERMVDARELFLRPDGSPDWKGRGYAYRQWAREAYLGGGVPEDRMHTVQSAVRYHVGAVLRTRMDEETLHSYGLISKTPRERSADRRESCTAVLRALESRDIGGGSMVALAAVQALITKIDRNDMRELSPDTKAVARAALTDLADLADKVRGLLHTIDTSE